GGGRWGGGGGPSGVACRARVSGAAAVIGAGLVTFVVVWFQPQKLFLSHTVNEPVPGVIQTAPARETSPNVSAGQSSPPGLQALRSGSFRSVEHAPTGKDIGLRGPGRRRDLRREPRGPA